MKKLVFILLVLVLAMVVAYATDAAKSGTLNGWIPSDSPNSLTQN